MLCLGTELKISKLQRYNFFARIWSLKIQMWNFGLESSNFGHGRKIYRCGCPASLCRWTGLGIFQVEKRWGETSLACQSGVRERLRVFWKSEGEAWKEIEFFCALALHNIFPVSGIRGTQLWIRAFLMTAAFRTVLSSLINLNLALMIVTRKI